MKKTTVAVSTWFFLNVQHKFSKKTPVFISKFTIVIHSVFSFGLFSQRLDEIWNLKLYQHFKNNSIGKKVNLNFQSLYFHLTLI